MEDQVSMVQIVPSSRNPEITKTVQQTADTIRNCFFSGSKMAYFSKFFPPFKSTFSWFFRLETVKTMPL